MSTYKTALENCAFWMNVLIAQVLMRSTGNTEFYSYIRKEWETMHIVREPSSGLERILEVCERRPLSNVNSERHRVRKVNMNSWPVSAFRWIKKGWVKIRLCWAARKGTTEGIICSGFKLVFTRTKTRWTMATENCDKGNIQLINLFSSS